MTVDTSQVGLCVETEEFRVSSTRLAQFAAATDDESVRHATGELAPPVFANVPTIQPMVEALRPITKGFVLHGQHDFHFHQPIVPGMSLFARATVQGFKPAPAGVSIIIRLETSDLDGTTVNTQYFSGFVVGDRLDSAVGEPAPHHRWQDASSDRKPIATVEHSLALDQTSRYADAARDYSDYCLKADAARSRGYDAVLVHGMLTMSLVSRAVVAEVCDDDSTRLKRLAGRFSKPVLLLPGQEIRTSIWELGRSGDRRVVAYSAEDASGETVMTHGVAEIEE